MTPATKKEISLQETFLYTDVLSDPSKCVLFETTIVVSSADYSQALRYFSIRLTPDTALATVEQDAIGIFYGFLIHKVQSLMPCRLAIASSNDLFPWSKT